MKVNTADKACFLSLFYENFLFALYKRGFMKYNIINFMKLEVLSMAKKCKPFRVGVIGCVEAAEGHIAALIAAPETKLVAFCDLNKERVKEFKKKYRVRRGYTNYMKMLRPSLFRRRIDAVHICLPSADRAGIAEYCLLKGRHVMIEPPIAFDPSAVTEVAKTAAYMGKNCGVLIPTRANATTAYVGNAVASGRLGRILSVRTVICAGPRALEAIYDAAYAEKASGRLLFEFAAPAIDIVDMLVGADVDDLSCSMANRAHAGEEAADSAEGVITYADGTKHSFYCTSNYENGGSTQISVLCENGEILFDASDVHITYADGSKDDMHDENPAMGCLDRVREFYTACREGTLPLTDVRAAQRLHEILLALYDDAMACGVSFYETEEETPEEEAPTPKSQRLWY